jgi:hypothetical protein
MNMMTLFKYVCCEFWVFFVVCVLGWSGYFLAMYICRIYSEELLLKVEELLLEIFEIFVGYLCN